MQSGGKRLFADSEDEGARRAVVWILDDSPLEAEISARSLSVDYTVSIFLDGAVMLEHMASRSPPDVLVLDQIMPNMSGTDICRLLRSTPATLGIAILILTIVGEEEDLIEGLSAGADDYVVKPYPGAALSARVAALVRSKRLRERARRMEKAAEVERELLRALIEQSGDGIMAANEQGVLNIFNPEAERQHGVPRREIAASEWVEAYGLLAMDGRPLPLDEFPLYRALIGGRGEKARWRVRRPGGTTRVLTGTASPLWHADGSPAGAVLITRDETDAMEAERALRESEERYRVIISALEEGITLEDAGGVIRTANASAKRILGLAIEEMVGRTTLDSLFHVINEDGSPFPKEQLPQVVALRTGEPQSNVPMGIYRADGALVWVSVNARPLRSPDGAIVGVVSSFFDISAQKRAEQERQSLLEAAQAAREQAECANRLKDEFLATLSHELRTPLTAVIGWVRMLRGSKLPEDRCERALQAIERNAQAQAKLVEDLLDVSRIMAGKLRLEVQPLDLVGVIEAAMEVVRPAADARGVTLEPLVDPSPSFALGDAARLQQVVWNLLSNAVNFTPRGGRVEVRLQRLDTTVEIVVSDTGQGIDPAFLPHVFEQFRQAESGSTRRHGGLGLGLAITKSLVELHGGTVRALSEGQGRGSSFVIGLPLDATRRPKPPMKQRAPAAILVDGERLPELRGLCVLVAEDADDTRELLVTMLEQYGARVTPAASAAEVLASLNHLLPDVIVSDIGMPGEDGYELIRKIRSLPVTGGGRIPVVALTAYARAEDRIRALRAGFNMHVPKPINFAELLAVIAQLAGRTAEI